jgi:two-component system, chemotaxis family, protein-glutamate methylesterase/glutaminase
MHKQGAFIIGQDASSSTIYGMPKEAFKANVIDKVLPLDMIASQLIQHTCRIE